MIRFKNGKMHASSRSAKRLFLWPCGILNAAATRFFAKAIAIFPIITALLIGTLMGSNVCGLLTQATQRALFIQAGLGTITLINF